MPFFKTYIPSPELCNVVREIQVYHINWNQEKNLPPPFITCLANTEQNLYLFPNDTLKVVPAVRVELEMPPAILTGPKYKPVGLMFGKDHLMVKVIFYPTGLFRLSGMPVKPLVNSGANAVEVWGEDVIELVDCVRSASSYDDMATIVADFLVHQLRKNVRKEEPIDKVVVSMLNPERPGTVEQWASDACLSVRQFERNFMQRVGISPKLFLRIVQFEWAMRVKNAHPEKSWSCIAADCGYTDSSHLLKEFRKFAEFTPSLFYLNPTSGYSEFPTG